MSAQHLPMAGKVVLITGGRQGIGKAFALAFAGAGADIAISDYVEEDGDLSSVAQEIRQLGRRSLAIKADVTRKPDVENMVNIVVDQLGSIDVLINNAGVISYETLLDTSEETWDQVIDVNLKGSFLCSQAAARVMVKQKQGNIINIASVNAFKARSPRAAMGIAKAGVVMLTRVLALELGPHNIRVNAIAPGATRTAQSQPLFSNPEAIKNILAATPLRRLGEPKDIVGAALFLTSDAASWITGHTIVIEGGFLA